MNMKRIITPAIFISLVSLLAACGSGESPKEESATNTGEKTNIAAREMAMMPQPSGDKFITVDSADTMILSYLNSINYTQNDSDLHSLIIDADSLRAYLNDTTIKSMKIMFAHTLNYINNGGRNVNCGYQSGKLTMIMVGYDNDGNYVFYNDPSRGNMVLNRYAPCPNLCPPSGTAANNLLK